MARLLIVLCLTAVVAYSSAANRFDEYSRARESFIRDEANRALGAQLTLNSRETRLNNYLMKLKNQDIQNGLLDPTSFAPAQHFFEVVSKINGTNLFKIIKKMPKGGVLHIHDTALCNLDYFVQLTYWDNLWQLTNAQTGQPQFKFSRTQPAAGWVLVRDERNRRGSNVYDSELRWMLSMYNTNPLLEDRDINSIWARFMEIFGMTDGVMMYKDAWRAYYLEALRQFEADGVNYLEIRSVLPTVSEGDGVT